MNKKTYIFVNMSVKEWRGGGAKDLSRHFPEEYFFGQHTYTFIITYDPSGKNCSINSIIFNIGISGKNSKQKTSEIQK